MNPSDKPPAVRTFRSKLTDLGPSWEEVEVVPATATTTEWETARDEAAEEMGRRHAHPEIRSMFPSTSRGEMASYFAQLFGLGASWAARNPKPDDK